MKRSKLVEYQNISTSIRNKFRQWFWVILTQRRGDCRELACGAVRWACALALQCEPPPRKTVVLGNLGIDHVGAALEIPVNDEN